MVDEPRADAPRPRLSFWLRRTHLLAALFLMPWVLVYASSTVVMQHQGWFTGPDEPVAPPFEVLYERPYEFPAPDADAGAVARAVLSDLDLEGAFNTNGRIEDGRLTILRGHALGSYRVTLSAESGTVLVERQPTRVPFVLRSLHRRFGYAQAVPANLLWGLVVDLFILALLVWVATGVWMWWEMSKTRRLGLLFLGTGTVAFLFLILVL